MSKLITDFLLLCLLTSSCNGQERKNTSCALSLEPPKKDTSKLSYMINEEHTALIGIKGYVAFSYEDSQADQMRYIPLKFDQFITQKYEENYALLLLGACTNLTIIIDPNGYVDYNPKSAAVNKFSMISLDVESVKSCSVQNPKLRNFLEHEYFSCHTKRILPCVVEPDAVSSNGTDAATKNPLMGLLAIQAIEFEINGKHNDIFKRKFSKQPRDCRDTVTLNRVMTTTAKPCVNDYYNRCNKYY